MVHPKNSIVSNVFRLIVEVLLAVLTAGSAAAVTPASKLQPPAYGKPNFIVILTDDLDLASVEFMPKLKELVTKHGTVFSNYFVTDSLCCPSRVSLLRGQYPHNHRVLSNAKPEGGFEKFYELGEEQSTLAIWLKAAGYRTVLLGKYLNEYPGKQSLYVPPGWDEWYAVMDHRAVFFNYRLNENGRAVSYGHDANAYEADVLAAKTVDFIARTSAGGKQPFFIYLAPSAPHVPAIPAPRHAEAFSHAAAPRTPAFNETDPSDKRHLSPLSPNDLQRLDRLYRMRLQSLLAVDDMVEKIVIALQDQGLLDQTYIFFTSDNGFHLGEHRLKAGKGTAYEEDIHVPLIVRGPGVPPGKTLKQQVLNIDLGPTLAELAGVHPPDFVDGRSFSPLLTGAPLAPPAWREDFVVEYWSPTPNRPRRDGLLRRWVASLVRSHSTPPESPENASINLPDYVALRTKNHLYVERANGERKLYDLNADPHELHNLIQSAAPGLIARLSERLAALEHCAGASCRQNKARLL
ncbi:MAG TPA: sulfatase [Candidatus Binatia bacterium]|jgi:arylsulfatase A-like enzyme